MISKIHAAMITITVLLFLVSCANPNIDSRIVGTWNSERMANSSYIFSSNGKFERNTAFNEHYEGTYTAVDGVLTLDYGEGYELKELHYEFNNDKNSSDYGDMKIGYDYFEKSK